MKYFYLVFFSLVLAISNNGFTACNDPSVYGSAIEVSEAECIQRLNESCVWAIDTNSGSGFSCQSCDTNVPSSDGRTISQCFSDHSSDLISAVVCAAKNSSQLSLENFCYNSMHGIWQESSFVGEDVDSANNSDIDSNDVAIKGLYSEVKLVSFNSALPLLISEVAILSPSIPGGNHDVDAMIYSPDGETTINEVATNTSALNSPVTLITDYNKLGLGFSTINLNQDTSQNVLDSLSPSLAYNYSFLANITLSDIQSFADTGSLLNDQLLKTNGNLFSRMGIKNKTLGIETFFDSAIPKFLGLPTEVILEEQKVYTNSLGLGSTATLSQVKDRVLDLKTKINELKGATTSATVESKKQEIKSLSSGVILNIKFSGGLYDKKSFAAFSPPKFVDGSVVMSKRSSTKSLDDYLENLLNGNIQNDKELISRGDLDSFFRELTGDANDSLLSVFGSSCSFDSDCDSGEKCRKNVCSCKNIECSGKSSSIKNIKFIIDSDELVVSQTMQDGSNLSDVSGVKNTDDVSVSPGEYFKTINQSLGGIVSKLKVNKQVVSNKGPLSFLFPTFSYASSVSCNNQDITKSCRSDSNTFYDSTGCPMSRDDDGFASSLGECLIGHNSKNPETVRGVMFLGQAAECLADVEGLILSPGSKQVLVDFSNQNHLDCYGGVKDVDMPDTFNLNLVVNTLTNSEYDFEIIFDPYDESDPNVNSSSSDATTFYIGINSASSEIISVMALEESSVANYVAVASFNQGTGVFSFDLIDQGVSGQIGRRSRAVVKGTVQASSYNFVSTAPVYYSGWQIEYEGQNSSQWYTFTSFQNDSAAGKENLVREYFINKWDSATTTYTSQISTNKKAACFNRTSNSLASNTNFCSPQLVGVKPWSMLIDNLVGNNLILDFNEYKNTAPVANFTEVNLANIPVIKSTNLEGVFCSGMGNLLTLKSTGGHSFSSFDWGFGGDSITLTGNSSTTDSKITGQVGGMDMYLEVKLLRDRSEGILHLVFPDAPYYITEHLYQSAQGCASDNYDPSTTPKIITENIFGSQTTLDKIKNISKFNSYAGHLEADYFTSCSNLKHYFCPMKTGTITWGSDNNYPVVVGEIPLHAPFDGKIVKINSDYSYDDISDPIDTTNLQLAIRSSSNPAYTFQFAHLNLLESFSIGDNVTSGEYLGTAFIDDGVQSPYLDYTGQSKGNSCIDGFLHMNDSQGSGGNNQYRLLSMFEAITPGVLDSFVQWNSDFTVDRLIVSKTEKALLDTALESYYQSNKNIDNYFCHLRKNRVDEVGTSIDPMSFLVDFTSDGVGDSTVDVFNPTDKSDWKEDEKSLSRCFMEFPASDDRMSILESTSTPQQSEKIPNWFGVDQANIVNLYNGCCTGYNVGGTCMYE